MVCAVCLLYPHGLHGRFIMFFIQVKSTYMFSLYLQSGVPGIFTKDLLWFGHRTVMFLCLLCLSGMFPKSSENIKKYGHMWYLKHWLPGKICPCLILLCALQLPASYTFHIQSQQWMPFVYGTLLYTFNSSPPSAANMRQWIRSALLQIMAHHLIGAKPLSKPMPGYCWLDP